MVNTKSTTAGRLMAAASKELQKGCGDFEMSAVAVEAGVSIGLAYHYFGSKAGLIAAVVEQFYEEFDRDVMMPSFGLPDWQEREYLRIQKNVAFHFHHPLATVVLRQLRRESAVIEIEQIRISRQVEEGTRNIRSAQRQGRVAAELDARYAAAFTLAGIRAVIGEALAKAPEDRPTEEDLTERLWQLVRRSIARANN